MNYQQIKTQSKDRIGMKFTQSGFRYAFNLPKAGSLKLLNQLINDGIIEKIDSQSFIIKAQDYV